MSQAPELPAPYPLWVRQALRETQKLGEEANFGSLPEMLQVLQTLGAQLSKEKLEAADETDSLRTLQLFVATLEAIRLVTGRFIQDIDRIAKEPESPEE